MFLQYIQTNSVYIYDVHIYIFTHYIYVYIYTIYIYNIYIFNLPDIYIYTSSTAQGGGGSFKNRKPIGEIGCCESLMAEQKH